MSSYNCRSLKSSLQEVQQLADVSDVVLLQETWLLNFELSMLSKLHTDFYGRGISAVDTDTSAISGRPHGGIAIMWRKTLGDGCKIIDLDDKRLMGIEIANSTGKKILLLNIYMPVSTHENKDEFIYYLSKIDSMISSSPSPYVFTMGDFNANTNMRNNNLFGDLLVKYCREENLILSDLSFLPKDSYTFLSEAHSTTAWLDHMMSTSTAHSLINKMQIKYDFISSDHHPVLVNISMNNINLQQDDTSEGTGKRTKIKWDKISKEEILQYKIRSEKELSQIRIEHGVILCDNPHCTDVSHINAIDRMYKATTDALINASTPLLSAHKPGYKHVQGWNTYCKELHTEARDVYLMWRAQGKQRQGFLFHSMKRTRAQFKRALRQCRQDESRTSADSLANNLLKKNDKEFWKEIKKCNDSTTPLASTVNNVTGGQKIANMWQGYFKDLLNSSKDNKSKDF